MRTPAQQAASRANGARSRGPKTAAGKRRSSRNALRHGLLARATVLQRESLAGFQNMLRQHIECIAPRNPVEQAAVEDMCAAAWRIRRLWCIERKTLDLEIATQRSPDRLERIVRAFDSLARNSPHFLLFHDYEARLHNIIELSLARLLDLRKSSVTNEPEPLGPQHLSFQQHGPVQDGPASPPLGLPNTHRNPPEPTGNPREPMENPPPTQPAAILQRQ
jgi:hypothetical protein